MGRETLTVAQLIAKLQEFDPKLKCFIGYDGFYTQPMTDGNGPHEGSERVAPDAYETVLIVGCAE